MNLTECFVIILLKNKLKFFLIYMNFVDNISEKISAVYYPSDYSINKNKLLTSILVLSNPWPAGPMCDPRRYSMWSVPNF